MLLVGDTAVNVTLPVAKLPTVCTNVMSELHVADAPEYSFAVNGSVPPVHVELNVTDCPLSIVGFDGLIVGVVIAEFTVT